jgi:phosphatidate cytidylyltransferase
VKDVLAVIRMSNFKTRLILTLVSIPIILVAIFWPQENHFIGILIFGIIIPVLGSYEINSLIYHKGINVRRFFLPSINTSIYIFTCLYVNNIFNIQKIKYIFPLFILYLIIVISSIYARDILKKELSKSFEKMSYTLFGLLYIGIPSFLFPFLLNVNIHPDNPVPIFYNIDSKGSLTSSLLMLYFITVVWTNDIFAYVFGMAFGRKNIIGLTASPNKSWAGYIGGYLSTFFFVIIYYLFFNRFLHFPTWVYFIFPLFSGILVPMGDLVESVFKRSANIKDSGDMIAGRGGILDSVDTILFVLPIFFILVQVYFSIINI